VRVDPNFAAGLRVDEPELADIGKLLLARIADLDGEDVVAAHHLEQRLPPVERAAEVGDDDDHPRWRATAAVRRSASPSDVAPTCSCSGSRWSASSRPSRPAALMRRQRHRLSVAEREHSEPVSAPRRDMPHCERDAVGDVGLAPVARAEVHRRRRVEQQPCHEHALGKVDAYVRLTGARRDVPLDAPDVVAGHVRPDLRKLDAVAVVRRPELAGEHSVQPAADLDAARAAPRRQRSRSGRSVQSKAAGARCSRDARPREAHLRHGHGRENLVEDRVGVTPSASAW
jgi:hypothetical protein